MLRNLSITFVAVAAVVCLTASAALAARYEQFTKKFAEGPHMSIAGATFFGSDAVEEFVAAEQLADGHVVAVGNSWGPSFPTTPRPTVLGKGRHTGGEPISKDRKGRTQVNYNDDTAGMVVVFSPDLSQVRNVLRLDWGVGRFGDAVATSDGKGLLIAGVAGPHFGTLAGAPRLNSGEAFVVLWRGGELAWIKPVGVNGSVAKLIPRADGGAYLTVEDGAEQMLVEVTADGRANQLMQRRRPNRGGFLTVDPADGNILFGGDRNTNTGKEPWRQPFLYKFDRKGEKLWTLWEYHPKKLRDGTSPGQGLVSDSSAYFATYAPNRDLLVVGWSDGGNSIFGHHPQQVGNASGKQSLGFSLWGANAGSFTWIMRLDPNTFEVKNWSNWAAFLPSNFMGGGKDKPNGTNIHDAVFLQDDAIAFTGGSATGLIATPNAFWKRPAEYEGKMGGQYVAVLRPDMTNAQFSSYLPGYDGAAVAASNTGLLVSGRTRAFKEQEDMRIDAPASPRAAQKQFGGGEYDAHIIHLISPGRSVGTAAAPLPTVDSPTAAGAAPQATSSGAATATTRSGSGGDSRIADARLKSARTYLKFDKQREAKAILQQIISDYPETEAATEAKKLLADM